MQHPANPTLSIIVPVYNEATNLPLLYKALRDLLTGQKLTAEIILVDDGSTDNSLEVANRLSTQDARLRVIELSRNFGKEVALTAGLHAARGKAALLMDADLQHPVSAIPEFIAKWHNGAEVVVGVRRSYGRVSLSKKLHSWLFYKLLNSMAEVKVVPHSTDFRLLDRVVIDEFNRFSERNRITRGLIDWLGFHRDYVYFNANDRASGQASYSFSKLVRLALNSFVSLSLFPLRLAGYFGIFITTIASLAAMVFIIGKYVLHNSYISTVTFRFMLLDLNTLLIGTVLMALGLIALYIANIHSEVINRPLYVIRREYGEVADNHPTRTT